MRPRLAAGCCAGWAVDPDARGPILTGGFLSQGPQRNEQPRDAAPNAEFAPVEGLAATLHARIVNGQELRNSPTPGPGPSTAAIKEEADDGTHMLMPADSSRLPHAPSPDLGTRAPGPRWSATRRHDDCVG